MNNLNKEIWTLEDKNEFLKYLESLEIKEKKEWTKNVVNTNMDVLAIKSNTINQIVKEILKGNYISFLDLNINKYYENTIINAKIISKIKDFNTLEKYLKKYVLSIDSWASCDALTFNTKNNEENFLNLSKKLIKNKKPFIRRAGVKILFYVIKNKDYLNNVFDILNTFYDEENYYVNMINSWLLCECFIKYNKETKAYLETHNLNKFTINKAISKCHDSYRVSSQDKQFLLKYRINNLNNEKT